MLSFFPFFLLIFLFNPKLGNSQIRISSDLNCSFSTKCLWQNDTQSAFVGFNLIGDLTSNKPFPVSDGPEENFFLSTVGPPGFSGQIGLLSEIIECQLGGAKLKFRHFQTGPNSGVEACIRYPPGSPLPGSLHCYGNFPSPIAKTNNHHHRQWEMANVELPPMTQPMELIIRATFEWPNSLVGIDDIIYEAILCETSYRGAAEGGGGRIDGGKGPLAGKIHSNQQISPLIVDTGKIFPEGGKSTDEELDLGESIWMNGNDESQKQKRMEKIDEEPKLLKIAKMNGKMECDFDKADICEYQNGSENGANIRGWMLANKPIGNPLTGIQKDQSAGVEWSLIEGGGWFLYAGDANATADHSPLSLHLLESNEWIHSSEPISLHFFYNLAGVRGRLRVCFANSTEDLAKNDDANCPFIREGWIELNELSPKIDPREWRKGEINVPIYANKVFFLADQLAKNYFVGLDSIKFMKKPTISDKLPNGIVSGQSYGINFLE